MFTFLLISCFHVCVYKNAHFPQENVCFLKRSRITWWSFVALLLTCYSYVFDVFHTVCFISTFVCHPQCELGGQNLFWFLFLFFLAKPLPSFSLKRNHIFCMIIRHVCDDNIWPQVTNYLVSDKQNLNTCPTMLKPRANSNNLAYKKGRINRQYPSFLKSFL